MPGAQFSLHELPETFNQVQIRTVRRKIDKVKSQFRGKRANIPAFLIPCVIQRNMDNLSLILFGDKPEHFADLRGGNVTVIGHGQHALGEKVNRAKDVITLATGRSLDEPTRFSVDIYSKTIKCAKSIEKQNSIC